MSTIRPTTDPQDADAAPAQARRRLQPGYGRSPAEVERILRERAAALAKPLPEPQSPTALLDLLVLSLAGARYGIETAYVLEVIPFRKLTAVPCTPPCVLGVVNYRGRILPVLDLHRLLELPGQDGIEGGHVVAVQAMRMTFGIFADAAAGTVRVAAQEASPSPATLTGEHSAIIRGVTKEMIAVLDLEALARDPRITVNEEVG